MGRQSEEQFIDRVEAARELGVSVRLLTTMCQRGIINPHHVSKKRQFFLLAEVQLTKVALNGDKNPDLREVKSLALQALAAARRTEQRLSDFADKLGLDVPPLPRDESYVRSLHEQAGHDFDPGVVLNDWWLRFWGESFFGMDETYFELVTLTTGDEEPWKVFIDFSSKVLIQLRAQKDDVPAQTARFFEAGRGHLRAVAWAYCQRIHSTTIAHELFGRRTSAVDELEAILG